MKIVLRVAAGVAVGLTVVLAVLVQVAVALLEVLERLAPLLVVLALVVVVVLHVVRRRGDGQDRHPVQMFPLPASPPAAAPSVVAKAFRSVADDQPSPYLRWGPPGHADDLDVPAGAYGAVAHVHRTRAGARPSRPGGGRRP